MRTARKNKKSAMTEDILRNLLRCFFKYNFKLLTAKNLFYTPQKTSLDARTSSRSNYISKNIFAKYNAIRLILFICTCVFKFNSVPTQEEKKTFPVWRYFTSKSEFVSNIF